MTEAVHPDEAAVLRRLSTLDRFLPLWIAMAMAGGLALGSLIPGVKDLLDSLQVGTVSLPIALGLLAMMYPVLAKVRYEDLGRTRGDGRMFGVSLFLRGWWRRRSCSRWPGSSWPTSPPTARGSSSSDWPAASPWCWSGTSSPEATPTAPRSWSSSTRSSRSSPTRCSGGSTSTPCRACSASTPRDSRSASGRSRARS